VSAAGKSLGEQIYRRVEELVATGKTAKDAFAVVSRERSMTVSNVQQHYYRFKRKAGTSARSTARKAQSRARTTASRAQKSALTAVAQAGAVVVPVVAQAGSRLPKKQRQAITKVSKVAKDDLAVIGADIVEAFYDLLQEARKNDRFRQLEKNLAELLTR
jgi:hypothetical protein